MFLVYILILILGTLILTAKNIWVHGLSLAELKLFFFDAMLFFNLVFLFLMQAFTYVRLRKVHLYFWKQHVHLEREDVLHRLHRFPSELFWTVILLSVLMSITFHITEFIHRGSITELLESEVLAKTFENFMSEQALAVIIAVMAYSLLRITLRPYLQSLQRVKIGGIHRTTITKPFLLTYISCSLVIIVDVLRSILNSFDNSKKLDMVSLMKIVTVEVVFSLGVVLLLIWNIRSEVRLVVEEIRKLAYNKRSQLRNPIHIGFADEIGQLTESFNTVQERISRYYKRIDEELELAYAVQEMLLPEQEDRFESFQVRVEGRNRESTGEWYDMVSLDDKRLAVIIGEVSGHGLPAALMVSTIIFILRSEIGESRPTDIVLSRVLDQVNHIFPQNVQINLGLALCHQTSGDVQLATIGEIEYGIQRHEEQSFKCAIIENTSNENVKLGKGDRLILSLNVSTPTDQQTAKDGRTVVTVCRTV